MLDLLCSGSVALKAAKARRCSSVRAPSSTVSNAASTVSRVKTVVTRTNQNLLPLRSDIPKLANQLQRQISKWEIESGRKLSVENRCLRKLVRRFPHLGSVSWGWNANSKLYQVTVTQPSHRELSTLVSDNPGSSL